MEVYQNSINKCFIYWGSDPSCTCFGLYGYLCRCNYQNAYGAYKAAAENYLGTVNAHFVKWCKENMAGIERKQRNPDAVVGFYRHPADFDNTLFYPICK